jgi:Zn-dependent protease with chaperone function
MTPGGSGARKSERVSSCWRTAGATTPSQDIGLAAASWLVLLDWAVLLLSRHRELSADRGTARLTGSPAQLDRMERALHRRSTS